MALAGLVGFLAVWTVAVHVAVIARLSLAGLTWFLTAASVAGAFAAEVARRRGRAARASDAVPPAGDHPAARWTWFSLAAALVLLYALTGSFGVFWWGAAAYVVAAACRVRPDARKAAAAALPVRASFADSLALLALALTGAALPLFVHTPNADDSFYVGSAAHALAHPNEAVWAEDGMYGRRGMPVHMPIYRVESYEMLVAAVARVCHTSALRAAHTLMPPVSGFATVLVFAVVASGIVGRRWLSATAICLAVAMLAGEAHRSPGNFAFVRLHQGKAIVATTVLPLLGYLSWKYVLAGGAARWCMVAATAVAAAGLSSTGLVIGPLVVLTCGAAAFTPGRPAARRSIALLATLLYPVAAAAAFRGQATAYEWVIAATRQSPAEAVRETLGAWQQYVFLTVALANWTLVADPARARLLLAPAAVLVLFLLNPLLAPWWMDHVTSRPTYWRVLWLVPWTLNSGLFCTQLVGQAIRSPGRLAAWSRTTLAAVCVAGPLALLGWRPVWKTGGSFIEFAAIKAPPGDLLVARRVVRATPEGTSALAPEAIATWIATFEHRPPLVTVRPHYEIALEGRIPTDDVRLRRCAVDVSFGGRTEAHARTLGDVLDRFDVGLVVLDPAALPNPVSALLQTRGFVREDVEGYSLWRRAVTRAAESPAP